MPFDRIRAAQETAEYIFCYMCLCQSSNWVQMIFDWFEGIPELS